MQSAGANLKPCKIYEECLILIANQFCQPEVSVEWGGQWKSARCSWTPLSLDRAANPGMTMRGVRKPACSAIYLTIANMGKMVVCKRTALHPNKIPTYYPAIWTRVCQGRSEGRISHCISFRLQNYSVEMVEVEAPQIITRATFRQVPTRRIRLSFVECAYLDLLSEFQRFKMDSAVKKDGTQLQNNNFGTFQAFTFIKQ